MMGLPCPLSRSVAVGAWLATQVARVLTEQPFVFACSARLFLPLCLSSSDRRTSPPPRLTRCSRWKIARSKEGSSSQESQLPTNEGITRNEVERRSGVACNNYASPIGAQSTRRHYCRVTESMTALHHISQPLLLPPSLPPQPI